MSGAAFACRRCGQEKPRTSEYFHAKPSGAGGLNSVCIPCRAEEARARKVRDPAKHAEKNRAAQKRYRAAHRENVLEKQREHNRAYVARRPDALLRGRIAYKQRHPDRVKAGIQRWRERYRERVREIARDWRANNPEKARARAKRWRLAHKHDVGRVAIRMRMSQRIKQHVERHIGGGKGGASWCSLVGYEVEDFIRHIERQFTRSMRWENWGTVWHLDHIVPVSSFRARAAGDDEFRACWALPNLRPLPARENLSKGAKRLYLL